MDDRQMLTKTGARRCVNTRAAWFTVGTLRVVFFPAVDARGDAGEKRIILDPSAFDSGPGLVRECNRSAEHLRRWLRILRRGRYVSRLVLQLAL